jgi:hypothetical protein
MNSAFEIGGRASHHAYVASQLSHAVPSPPACISSLLLLLPQVAHAASSSPPTALLLLLAPHPPAAFFVPLLLLLAPHAKVLSPQEEERDLTLFLPAQPLAASFAQLRLLAFFIPLLLLLAPHAKVSSPQEEVRDLTLLGPVHVDHVHASLFSKKNFRYLSILESPNRLNSSTSERNADELLIVVRNASRCCLFWKLFRICDPCARQT